MKTSIRFIPPSASGRGLAWTWASALVLAFTLPVFTASATESKPPPSCHPNVIPPFGNLYGRLGAAWWQWALSFPPGHNPIDDSTGAVGQEKQKGPVWFLAGNHGGATERQLTVPLGKPLFFPVINNVWVTTCVGEPRTRDGIRPLIAPFIDAATDLAVEIDGVAVGELSRFRAESPLFCTPLSLFGVEDPGDLAGFCPGGTSEPDCAEGVDPEEHWGTSEGFGPAMTDGYWLLLRPMSLGEHIIRFRARSGDFSLDVTYHLNVVRPPIILPPQSHVFGKSYAEWAARFWQWGLGIPEARNPLADTTGEFCDEGQSGPVWFLGWSFGGSVEKSCTVPRGKFIFTPVYNWIFGAGVFDCDPTVPGVPCDVPSLRATAAANVEAAEIVEVTIDGLRVQDPRAYRAASRTPFPVTFPEGAVFGIPAGTHYPHVADGYWLMLAPLPPGEHEIRVRVLAPGTSGGDIDYSSVYHLTVE